MKYEVHVVGDADLPGGVERVIVERENEPPLLVISGETARSWQFVRSWEDTQEPCWQPTVALPFKLRAVG